jgi:hypothetical protein
MKTSTLCVASCALATLAFWAGKSSSHKPTSIDIGQNRTSALAVNSATDHPFGDLEKEHLGRQIGGLLIQLKAAQQQDLISILKNLGNASDEISRGVYTEAFKALCARAPETALKIALDLPAGVFRDRLAQTALHSWGKSSPNETLNWLESQHLNPGTRNLYYSAFLRGWAENNPRDAGKYLLQDDPTRSNSTLISVLAFEIGRRDPAYAESWIKQLSDWRQPIARQSFFQGFAQVNPKAAAEAAMALPAKAGRFTSLNDTIKTWMDKDASACTAWVNTLPKDQRSTALRYTLESAAKTPEQFFSIVSELGQSHADPQANQGILYNLYTGSPPAATKWINGLPPDALAKLDISNPLSQMMTTDLLSTVEWLKTISDTAIRDKGIAHLAINSAKQEPSVSQAAIMAITDPQLRAATMRKAEMMRLPLKDD